MKDSNPEITDLIIQGIQERKGRHITHIDLSAVESSAARDFIVCEGTSTTHVAAIADCVRDFLLDNHRIKPYNYDGYRNSSWTTARPWSTYSCPTNAAATTSRNSGATDS